MAIEVKHAHTAAGTEAGNGEVGKAQWNASHALSMASARLLGRTTAGAGAVEEISVSGLSLSAGVLTPTALSVGNSSLTVTDTGSDGTVTVTTEGVARMVIDASGQVGIGATPSAKLDVDGTVRLRQDYTETISSATGSTTINLANGTITIVTTNGNNTITLPSSTAGKSYLVIVAYTGTHSITWAGGGTLKWAGGAAPSLSSASGKYDIFSFFCDGTRTFAQMVGKGY